MYDKKITITAYIIAAELHEDGTPHIHCYLELDKKFDSKTASALDITQFGGGNPDVDVIFHGDYRGCRDNTAVMKYVSQRPFTGAPLGIMAAYLNLGVLDGCL